MMEPAIIKLIVVVHGDESRTKRIGPRPDIMNPIPESMAEAASPIRWRVENETKHAMPISIPPKNKAHSEM